MIALGKRNLIGVMVDAVDYDSATEQIIGAARTAEPFAVSALAVHGVMTGALDAGQRRRLNALDLVVPDGQPVRWALNALHGTALQDRVCGPELMLRVCERAGVEGLPIFLYGSTDRVLATLSRALRRRFPELVIAGARPSLFRPSTQEERERTLDTIRQSGAAIVFVGLGCPRQEIWAYECRDPLSMPVVAVGAAFEFNAGIVRRAPDHLQRWGLEWLFRLGQEPRRLWRRYALLNPAFVVLAVVQALGLRRFDPFPAVHPSPVLPG